MKDLVAKVQSGTDAATQNAHSLTSFAIVVMIAMGAAAFIGSLLFVWLYVGRNILRRIGNLQGVMQRLAQGDLAGRGDGLARPATRSPRWRSRWRCSARA